MDPVSSVVLEKGLSFLFDRYSSGIRSAFRSLAEHAGIDTAIPFESVSDFWHRGVDGALVKPTSKVKIKGVVSLYTPLVPAHPRSRPGRQVQTWVESRGATDAFSTKNFVLWGDGVLMPPVAQSNRAVLGFFDKYGLVGFASIPVIVDLNSSTLRKAYQDIRSKYPRSFEAEVTGRIVRFDYSLVEDFGLLPSDQLTKLSPRLPNYVVEAVEIKLGNEHGVLYGTQWIGLGEKKMFPIYINLLDQQQRSAAISELMRELALNEKAVQAVFDTHPFNMKPGNLPKLNQYLEDALRD